MAQYRLVDQISSISGKISPYFGEGSAFNRYIGSPAVKGGAFFQRITIGHGTLADFYIGQPFWNGVDALANSPLFDPGFIMSLEQSGAGAFPWLAFQSVRSLNALKVEANIVQAASAAKGPMISNVRAISAANANAPFLAKGWDAPYS